METPIKEIEHRKQLLEEARLHLAEGKLDMARKLALEAIPLDEFCAQSFELLAEISDLERHSDEAAQWRQKAKDVRYEVWKKGVEAEVRGHHDVLGTAVRHEIP